MMGHVRHRRRIDQSGGTIRKNGHARIGTALKGAVQYLRLISGQGREGMHLGNLVEVGFVIRIQRHLLGHSGTFHALAQVRQTSQKERMIIGVAIGTLGDTTKAPTIGLTDKRTELCVLKKLG